MPTVPTGNGLGNVGLRPVGGGGLQRVDTNILQFGGAEAAAVARGGQLVEDASAAGARVARQRQEEREARDVLNLMNAAELDVGEYMRGAVGKREADARGIADTGNTWLEEYGTKAMQPLSPRAQAAFRAKYGELVNRSLNRLTAHELAEDEAERKGLVTRTAKTQFDRAAAGAGDEYEFANALKDYEAALILGEPSAEQRKFLRDGWVSEARLAVVDRLAVNDAEAALKYFREHEQEIAGGDRARAEGTLNAKVAQVQKTLEERASKAVPYRLAQQAFSSGGDYEAQADAIREAAGEDYELVDRALAELGQLYTEREKARDFELDRTVRAARGLVTEELTAAQREGREPRDLDAVIPVSVQAELAGTEKWSSLVSFYEKRQKGEEPQTNWAAYWGLESMAAGVDAATGEQNPALVGEFKNLDLQQMVVDGVLAQGEANKLMQLQVKLREGKNAEKAQRSIRTVGGQLGRLLQNYDTEEQRGLIAQRYYDAIEAYKDRNNGQEPDEAELTRISTGLLFNPPEKNIPQYRLDARKDVVSGLMQMPEVGGKRLPADVFGTMGRALRKAGRPSGADEVQALAEAIASAGYDPGVPYTEKQYADMIAAMGLVER